MEGALEILIDMEDVSDGAGDCSIEGEASSGGTVTVGLELRINELLMMPVEVSDIEEDGDINEDPDPNEERLIAREGEFVIV